MRQIGLLVSVLVAGCIKAEENTPPGPPLSPDSGIADGGGIDASHQDGGGIDQGGTGMDAGTTACDPTTPTRVASPTSLLILDLAVDALHVFWRSPPIDPHPGFYLAPKEGGEVTLIAGVRSRHADGIDADLVLDRHGLFIVEGGRGGLGERPGSIERFDRSGNHTWLAQGLRYPCGWVGHPRRVSTDPSRVYWIEEIGHTAVVPDPLDPLCDANDLRRARYLRSAPKRGGEARSPVRIPSLNLAIGEEFVYFTEGTTLHRLPKDGGPWEPVVTDLRLEEPTPSPLGELWPVLAIDGDDIYVGGRDGSVYAVDLLQGVTRGVAGSSGVGSRVEQFAFDERHVYWASTGEGGGIRRAPKRGGPSELVLPGGRLTVAVDERYFYYVQNGAVWRRCK